MKQISKFLVLATIIILQSCGGSGEKKKEGVTYGKPKVTEAVKKVAASQRIDLANKGVGPITSVELASVIDQTMATHGQEIYQKMCTACHRPDKKFIGPAPLGILERRSPEWVMNMILNPEEMIQKDPLAKDLLMEFNGAPMANQNLKKEEARAVLEYFRTLK